MKASQLGWSWLGLKVLAFLPWQSDTPLVLLALVELPLLVWWIVTAIRELSKNIKKDDKTRGWLTFQIIIAGLFLILWITFFAIGVSIGMGET